MTTAARRLGLAAAILLAAAVALALRAGGRGQRGRATAGAGADTAAATPDRDEAPAPAPEFPARPEPQAAADPSFDCPACAALERLLPLWESEAFDDTSLARVRAEEDRLIALGDAALPELDRRLRAAGTPALRERLFDVIRRIPGPHAERAVIAQAISGAQSSLRAMAIESLGQRRTDAALAALTNVALHDPDLPARPLVAEPRHPDDPGTELPDEQVYTPRMKAMAALAGTGDPRALDTLSAVARGGPDESLRMEAATLLGRFQGDARAADALRFAAASDPSAYVRLAALHALSSLEDPAQIALVEPVLRRIAEHDADLGVRTLAGRVLGELGAH